MVVYVAKVFFVAVRYVMEFFFHTNVKILYVFILEQFFSSVHVTRGDSICKFKRPRLEMKCESC